MNPKVDGISRRIRADHWCPAEKAIQAAVDAVEATGAHPFLTDAVVLLSKARSKVADFVELPKVGDEVYYLDESQLYRGATVTRTNGTNQVDLRLTHNRETVIGCEYQFPAVSAGTWHWPK